MIIEKKKKKVTVFDFENDNMFEYDFTQNIPVLIYNGELDNLKLMNKIVEWREVL